MVRIQNVNISFERVLVENSCIDLPSGKITVISGVSGSGKTSLLYRIGLISSDTDYDYYFNDSKIDIKKDNVSSGLRKTRIGYVFQENSVINSLTIKENVKLSARIAGIELSAKRVKKWLSYVGLDININSYPKNLSGGERQKLAIACALAKEPELIIADEPTSALDKENSNNIMQLFRKIANEGKTVVVASHDASVSQHVDVVYEINNKKIDLISGEAKDNAKPQTVERAHQIKFRRYVDYALTSAKHYKFQKRFVSVLCAVVIAISASLGIYIKNFALENYVHLDNLAKTEIFVVNKTTGVTPVVMDSDLVLDKQQQEGIRSLFNYDNVYDYLEFKSFGKSIYTGSDLSESTITVIQDGRRNPFVFMTTGSEKNSYSVINYFDEQQLDKRLKSKLRQDSSNTIKAYISSSFADTLGIEPGQSNVTVQMQIAVPVALFNSTYKDKKVKLQTINNDLCVSQIISVGIAGILSDDVLNTYSNTGNNSIYIHHNEMKKIQSDIIDRIGEYAGVANDVWAPRAFVAFAVDYNQIGLIQSNLESISPTIKTICNYKDIVSINKLIHNINNISTIVILCVLLIIFIFMAIIQMNSVVSRKYEISVLKSNGMSKFEIFKLVMVEQLLQALKIIIISCTISIILTSIINVAYNMGSLMLYLYIIVYTIVVAFISITLPTIITLVIFNRFKPDKIMRN